MTLKRGERKLKKLNSDRNFGNFGKILKIDYNSLNIVILVLCKQIWCNVKILSRNFYPSLAKNTSKITVLLY